MKGIEYFLLFLIYSYLGATLEHLSYFFGNDKPKALTNPIITGFPLYGTGALIILLLAEKMQNVHWSLQFLVYGFVMSLFEYIIGKIVGAGEKSYKNGMVWSWDYSNEKYNYEGIISLRHFVCWGILGLILTKINPYILKIIRLGIYS